jgi:hypothetical protein
VEVVIEGRDLPGKVCRVGDSRRANVHVGVQRRKETVDVVAGDAAEAGWTLNVDAVDTGDGFDFRGAYVHGPQGDRFLSLSWGTFTPAGDFEMFRRAKLELSGVDPALIQAANKEGAQLVGRLRLTAADGSPVAATVKPPALEWSVRQP